MILLFTLTACSPVKEVASDIDDAVHEILNDSPQRTSGKRPVAFVVDDSRTSRIATESRLVPLGLSVYSFQSGNAAIKEISRLNPAVIVTDYKMKNGSGLVVARRASKAKIPTIIITATSRGSDAWEKLRKSASRIRGVLLMPKEDSHEHLTDTVRKVLDKNSTPYHL